MFIKVNIQLLLGIGKYLYKMLWCCEDIWRLIWMCLSLFTNYVIALQTHWMQLFIIAYSTLSYYSLLHSGMSWGWGLSVSRGGGG